MSEDTDRSKDATALRRAAQQAAIDRAPTLADVGVLLSDAAWR